MPNPKMLKMKDLERMNGVGRETIRYYIHEGLLPEPERPARNVAWYSEEFVERIDAIKELSFGDIVYKCQITRNCPGLLR